MIMMMTVMMMMMMMICVDTRKTRYFKLIRAVEVNWICSVLAKVSYVNILVENIRTDTTTLTKVVLDSICRSFCKEQCKPRPL